MIQLCNIRVLASHIVGAVGKRLAVSKDELLVGVYQFEIGCGSLVCCLVGEDYVYFDAEKVRITAAVGIVDITLNQMVGIATQEAEKLKRLNQELISE